jgi:N-acetylmuramoyl-L-alanine amidase
MLGRRGLRARLGIYYTIKQGDHVARLAEQYGFRDYKTVWMDPGNADLRAQRPDPNVLYPGDILYIPDKQSRDEQRPTDHTHFFVVKKSTIKLRIKIRDFDNLPIAAADCRLEIDGTNYPLTTDGDGLIEQEIPKASVGGTLTLPDLDYEVRVTLGTLDPVDENTGWQQRLINLGYYWGPLGDAPNDVFTDYALQEFQCDYKLPITGQANDATRAKLKDVYGS